MKIKIKQNGLLVDCTMDIENGNLVVIPLTEPVREEKYDINEGWIIMLNRVPVIRKVFPTRQKAVDYACRYWKRTNFEFCKVIFSDNG